MEQAQFNSIFEQKCLMERLRRNKKTTRIFLDFSLRFLLFTESTWKNFEISYIAKSV